MSGWKRFANTLKHWGQAHGRPASSPIIDPIHDPRLVIPES
ncbi:hypothetical protein [Pseudomonas weihenstephanensis]|nr:hypothetical protein [Pseudomonas weihenstephanensis]